MDEQALLGGGSFIGMGGGDGNFDPQAPQQSTPQQFLPQQSAPQQSAPQQSAPEYFNYIGPNGPAYDAPAVPAGGPFNSFNFGPGYGPSNASYPGAPPPASAPLAPPIWDTGFSGPGGAPKASGGMTDGQAPHGPPPGALLYGGMSFPENWQDYNNGDISTNGGFFTIDQVYRSQNKTVPGSFQAGATLPSTNNWRLMPAAYRAPNFIMRNGNIIDMNSDTLDPAKPYHGGSGFGVPSLIAYSKDTGGAGWPGSLSGWMQIVGGSAGS